MPISIPLLRALVVAGASAGAIVDAVEEELAADRRRELEDAKSKQSLKREQVRARVRDYRERERVVASSAPDATATTDAASCNASNALQALQPPSSSSPLTLPLITTPSVVGVGDAPARDEIIASQARHLAGDIYRLMGINAATPPPGWTQRLLVRFLEEGARKLGWRPDVVLVAVEIVAAQHRERRKPLPYSCRYLTKPIASAHDDEQRSLPLANAVTGQSEQSRVPQTEIRSAGRAGGGGDYGARKDEFRVALAELRAANAAAPDGSDSGGAAVHILRAPGCR
jgi:hypothetical protein